MQAPSSARLGAWACWNCDSVELEDTTVFQGKSFEGCAFGWRGASQTRPGPPCPRKTKPDKLLWLLAMAAFAFFMSDASWLVFRRTMWTDPFSNLYLL